VGTVGKLKKIIKFAGKNKPFFDPSRVKYFVVDEADELLKPDYNNEQTIK